ncbi:Hematopoietic progenitor cell antigen CD34 [Sciurus carolinensis]|uniref:Hematopoietic progenitor cell antigen CD34 n=1 Tax=Sciurus carolinensis TaxID=30640 RepID=A0AA41N2W0_SCICA|nr:hematopoietic progenitor cell antigen CD34 isoform X1 [Sciurus carolinensis]MBZ3882760.1 Hematopoietic progenitor cell antigen CD34 [Sciurus carolinensis]
MLGRRGARAGPGMPRGWTALCLLSLLPSGFTIMNNLTTVAPEPSTLKIFSTISTNVSSRDIVTLSLPASNSSHPASQDSNETTSDISETTVNFTSTSGITPVPETTNSSVQSQTSVATTVSTTLANVSTSEMTLKPSMPPINVSDYSPNSTSPVMTSPTKPYTPSSPAPSTIKGEIKCSGIREVRLTQGICLELNETSSCEDFKKDRGEDLIQILCGKEDVDAGTGMCSLLLAQSEVKPQCLLLVLANGTELPSKLLLMEKHQSKLRKLGIQGFMKQDIGSHQSYSRKTLIALVTSGILLAVLGTTGYFLMNRRSWSPTGERLGEDPYYTENGGGQGYSSGPGSSSEAQGKASVNRGAQENGTGQATSRNGHSARQHVVADTEL